MSDVTPDILQISAAVLAAVFASAASLAASALYGRFALGPACRAVDLRRGRSRGAFAAFRSAAIAPLARGNERWVPAAPLAGIDRWLRKAGRPLELTAAEVVGAGRKGPLREELRLAIRELRLGKTREETLRDLSRRLDLPPLTSFVQALVHADKLGTPLGNVLRVLSTQMRSERTQRAERLANEAPVKLLLPLVLFIFPTLFLMLFGPIGYQVFLGGSF